MIGARYKVGDRKRTHATSLYCVTALLLFVSGATGGYLLFSSPRGGRLSDSHGRVAQVATNEPDSPNAVSDSTDSKAQRLVIAARRKGGTAMERQNDLYLA